LPTHPTIKAFAVSKLLFLSFHGMEEVAGSIPARSTNLLNQLNRRKLESLYSVDPQRTPTPALSLFRPPAATRHTPGKTALSTL
jgi:hypothetical protein